MENTERNRNLELLGIRANRTMKALKNLSENTEVKSETKVIKFKRKKFARGKYDDVLYNVQAVNQEVLNEFIDPDFNRKKLLRESTFKYDDFSKGLLEYFPKKAKAILVSSQEGTVAGVRGSLDEINQILEGEGYQEVVGANHWCSDWGNTVGLYIDMGDDNTETVFYDTIKEEFMVTSKNDFILNRDSKYRII